MSESMPSLAGTSTSYLNERAMPPLVTPGQLLQSGPTATSTTHPSPAQKDVEVVQVPASALLPSPPAETKIQEPLLPLPSTSDHKPHGTPMYIQHYNRRGCTRGKGNRISRSVTRFTEEFDFMAMNEKFNKDDVWGDLGKSNEVLENR